VLAVQSPGQAARYNQAHCHRQRKADEPPQILLLLARLQILQLGAVREVAHPAALLLGVELHAQPGKVCVLVGLPHTVKQCMACLGEAVGISTLVGSGQGCG
jgi:hypothetical protein